MVTGLRLQFNSYFNHPEAVSKDEKTTPS